MATRPERQSPDPERHGLAGAAGVAGDPATEPEGAPESGSDADELGGDAITPAEVGESLIGLVTPDE